MDIEDFDMGDLSDATGDEGASDEPAESGGEAAEGTEAVDAGAVSDDEVPEGTGEETTEEEETPPAEPPEEIDLAEDYALTVKVNGEEREVPISELVQHYQTSQAAHEQFRKAADERKAARGELEKAHSLVEAAKSDPAKFLAHIGVNPLKWAIERVQEAQAFQKMTPEQRQLHMEQRRIAEERARIEADRAAIENEQKSKAATEQRYAFVNEFLDHLDEIGFSEDEGERRRVLGVVDGLRKKASEDGVDLPLAYVVKQAIERLTTARQGTFRSYLQSLTDEQLLAELGPERARAFRAAEARKTAAAKPQPKPQPRRRAQAMLEPVDLDDLLGA